MASWSRVVWAAASARLRSTGEHRARQRRHSKGLSSTSGASREPSPQRHRRHLRGGVTHAYGGIKIPQCRLISLQFAPVAGSSTKRHLRKL